MVSVTGKDTDRDGERDDDRPVALAAALPDGLPDDDDEIRDPVTGRPDRYVPGGPVDAPELTDTVEVPAQSTGEFPLWPVPAPTPTGRSQSAMYDARQLDVPRRPPRRPMIGLPLLVLLAFAAALFGWLGAEPLWMAAGHADHGTIIVTRCDGSGISRRCAGAFSADNHRFTVPDVPLAGAAPTAARVDARLPARMVGSGGRMAYTGGTTGLTLRWAIPLAVVLLCGVVIALVTGAWRLPRRYRMGAVTLSLLGPVAIGAGILAMSW